MWLIPEFCFTLIFLQDVVIQTEDEIRVKIVGTRVDATDIVSLQKIHCHVLHLFSVHFPQATFKLANFTI